jgi:hypothetical protein
LGSFGGSNPVAKCHFLISFRINSIQIQTKFKLLKFVGT